MALNIDNSLGSLLIGIALSYLLYGVTCAQTLYYFYHYQDDRYILKTWVAYIWLVDTAKLVTEGHQLWFYFLARHDNLFALIQVDVFILGEQIIEGLLILSVQWYFLHKNIGLIKTRRSKAIFSGPAAALFLLGVASYLWAVYGCYKVPSIEGTIVRNFRAAMSFTGATLAMDLYITGAFCYSLRQNAPGFKRTKHIMSRLIGYLVNRGLILCLASLVVIVVYCMDARYGTYYSEIVHTPLGTLYANSLLALLNVRNHVSETDADDSLAVPSESSTRNKPRTLNAAQDRIIYIM